MRSILFLLPFILAACAGGPVGYGGSHQILHQDSDVITIQYDELLESFADVKAVADAYCGETNRKAVVSNVHKDTMTMGLVKTYTFTCKT